MPPMAENPRREKATEPDQHQLLPLSNLEKVNDNHHAAGKDNLGNVCGDYPHIVHLWRPRL